MRRVFRAVGKTDDGRVELKRLAKSIWSPELQVNSTGEVDGAEASPSEIDQLNQLISAKKASPHSAHNNNQQHSQQAGQDDSVGSAGVEADNLNRSMSFSEQALDPAAADGSGQQQVAMWLASSNGCLIHFGLHWDVRRCVAWSRVCLPRGREP